MKHAICASLLLVAGAAFAAEDYPAKPIQMIVPFPAGGPADIVGRLYAQHLSAVVGQPVVTLNRDGASGSIGTAAAARAAPDGYTLVFGTTSTMVVNPRSRASTGNSHDLASPPPGFIVAYHAALLRVVVRRETLAHFPFAELESVPQHVAESLRRRTSGVARQLLQTVLLGLA